MATHNEVRPFICTHEGCGKSFKRADALENHLRIHTGETPFVCPYEGCTASFATKASLRYHVLKHKDAKIYKCTYPGCNKSFITLFQLKQHEKARNVHNKITTKIEYQNQTSSPINSSASESNNFQVGPTKKVKTQQFTNNIQFNQEVDYQSSKNTTDHSDNVDTFFSKFEEPQQQQQEYQQPTSYCIDQQYQQPSFNQFEDEFFNNMNFNLSQQNLTQPRQFTQTESNLLRQNNELKRRLELSEKLLLNILKEQSPETPAVKDASEFLRQKDDCYVKEPQQQQQIPQDNFDFLGEFTFPNMFEQHAFE
eukprot:CAMPEP_0114592770 /NCGR_PEP_ID=MMETSP0125-20121206/14517_1 /TAXON_ID=485358 ORGANISM="Aristerostoma sp., Strain ATCC 50986" /NCGR_SAMPLE_ID=MMETSP0125 /ASSEMBLY_ACC=CAM_ASM_000245 /LENGTH=308 /DNA_ID=CAMNT_0001791587 /DNA_START=278 /DNA_END=1204 /DNA_ORIENTATION=+